MPCPTADNYHTPGFHGRALAATRRMEKLIRLAKLYSSTPFPDGVMTRQRARQADRKAAKIANRSPRK